VRATIYGSRLRRCFLINNPTLCGLTEPESRAQFCRNQPAPDMSHATGGTNDRRFPRLINKGGIDERREFQSIGIIKLNLG